MPLNEFRQLLKQRNIALYSYDVEDFELDLEKPTGVETIVIVISDTSAGTYYE